MLDGEFVLGKVDCMLTLVSVAAYTMLGPWWGPAFEHQTQQLQRSTDRHQPCRSTLT